MFDVEELCMFVEQLYIGIVLNHRKQDVAVILGDVVIGVLLALEREFDICCVVVMIVGGCRSS